MWTSCVDRWAPGGHAARQPECGQRPDDRPRAGPVQPGHNDIQSGAVRSLRKANGGPGGGAAPSDAEQPPCPHLTRPTAPVFRSPPAVLFIPIIILTLLFSLVVARGTTTLQNHVPSIFVVVAMSWKMISIFNYATHVCFVQKIYNQFITMSTCFWTMVLHEKLTTPPDFVLTLQLSRQNSMGESSMVLCPQHYSKAPLMHVGETNWTYWSPNFHILG